ncbi:MAG TPA: TonB-dependent receptor [Thermoanaerobaculia bacterium]|nr:TonB-dependent receptor [Thermoanaerobaculia bacterium]
MNLSLLVVLAATLSGTVKDSSGTPVSGATVSVANVRSVTTDAAGTFSLDLGDGTYDLRVMHPGFDTEELQAKAGDRVDVTLDPAFAETITVSGIRAEAETPVTKSDLPREEIEKRYYGQDVPLLLRDAPAVTAFSESGAGGTGYSYISLRGVSPSRINFTLDGVPLADSEDMGTYFADFPDLARSLESVQIQRGVGTSTVGTPSFGGSVNMQSIDLGQEQRVDATLGAGSFGGRQVSAGWHSGALPTGLALYARVSYLENEGFRDNSGVRQRNVFLSGSKTVGDALLKVTGFSGHMEQQASYYATEAALLETNPRANPLRPEEKDDFGYDLGQVQYIRPLGGDADMTASVYYQRGYGWFRLFSSAGELRQYGLDGMLLGAIGTYSRTRGAMTLNTGLHVNRFKRDHTRDNIGMWSGLQPAEDGGLKPAPHRDYANYGVKGEANAFAKLTYTAGKWLLYGDAQVRHATFDYHGDVDIESIDWTFFNPKIGVRHTLNARSSIYASAGTTTREPARNDMFLGQDNLSEPLDPHAVRPERVVDIEAGWDYRAARFEWSANLYAMEFRNEIAATGGQSETGMALRRNVDRSFRRGVELDAAWQASAVLRLRTVANLSRNRIRDWTQSVDVYDASGAWAGSRALAYRDVEPLLTPSVILSQAVDYTPGARFRAGAIGRYVGRAYLDNTNHPDLDTPAYFTADATLSYAVTPWARVTLQVNNVFDNDRIRPSGYSYLYYAGEELTRTAYYYPQATRNAVVLLDLGF